MSDNTKIEWCDATWNPIRGCSRVSAGCMNCYAERTAARFNGAGEAYEGLADKGKWTGDVRLIEHALTWPQTRKRPRKIFVNSMSDLFHENLPDAAIDRVFGAMALAPQHTFQVLTKRPRRMLDYMTGVHRGIIVAGAAQRANGGFVAIKWPLPNVWIGVSVEDQAAANMRVPLLLETPAAVRFLSCEPLIGPVSLRDIPLVRREYPNDPVCELDALTGRVKGPDDMLGARVDWVIAGGESGPRARPMHPAWVRSLRDQCAEANVPYFFKQWGEWAPRSRCNHVLMNGQAASEIDPDATRWPCTRLTVAGNSGRELANSGDGGDTYMQRVGKPLAGSRLDGIEHKHFPAMPLPAERS